MLKLGYIRKRAISEEEAIKEQQRAAMTDPNVVSALDYQEQQAEREELQMAVQQLQQQLEQTQQSAAQADQMAQEQSAANQELQAQVQQAAVAQQAATEQMIAAKDTAMQEQVTSQQNREQLMQAADQLALQLKQVAAQPTQSEQTATAEQQQMQQQAQAAGAPAEGEQPPPSSRTEKEVTEAQKAQEQAARQTEQAQQSAAQDQAKVQVNVGGAPQPPTTAASPVKTGSDRSVELMALLDGHVKQGFDKVRAAYAGGGAVLGAGQAGLEQMLNRRKHGKDAPSDKEIDLSAKLQAAQTKVKRDPTYANKGVVSALRFRHDLAQSGREHPLGAMGRGAVQGAVLGSIAGPSAHRLGGWVKKLVQARGAAAAAAKAAKGAVS